MECKITLVASPDMYGVSMYCNTCHDPIAWLPEWTLAEVRATVKGHKEVRARAKEAQRAYEEEMREREAMWP